MQHRKDEGVGQKDVGLCSSPDMPPLPPAVPAVLAVPPAGAARSETNSLAAATPWRAAPRLAAAAAPPLSTATN